MDQPHQRSWVLTPPHSREELPASQAENSPKAFSLTKNSFLASSTSSLPSVVRSTRSLVPVKTLDQAGTVCLSCAHALRWTKILLLLCRWFDIENDRDPMQEMRTTSRTTEIQGKSNKTDRDPSLGVTQLRPVTRIRDPKEPPGRPV